MIRSRPPHPEPEVLAARTRRAAAVAIASPDHLTPEQAIDTMLPAVIEAAAGFAERAFLAVAGIVPLQSARAAAEWGERITVDVIADMMADAARIADDLQATPEQRRRLEVGRAVLFDTRLAELQAGASQWGLA